VHGFYFFLAINYDNFVRSYSQKKKQFWHIDL